MYAGLDIGGTKTAVLIVDQDLKIRSRFVSKTRTSGPAELMDGVIQSVYCALEEAEAPVQELKAIGAGLPGRVSPETGVVDMAVNLNLVSLPFSDLLSAAFGVPVFIENDVRAAALGTFDLYGKQKGVRQMAYLSIGTGISAGLVLDGRLYRGYTGMAGEVGHVRFEPEGKICRCGARGCLETVASGPALAQNWREMLPAEPERPITAKDVYAAAQRGEVTAVSVIEKASRYWARAIQLLIMMYDIEKLILGGGVTRVGAAFLDPLQSALAQIRGESSLAEEMLDQNKIAVLPPDSDVPTWGAVQLALG